MRDPSVGEFIESSLLALHGPERDEGPDGMVVSSLHFDI